MIQSKKPVRRAFTGLAGSPLAVTTTELAPPPSGPLSAPIVPPVESAATPVESVASMPKKRGRPKKHTTNSARMSAHYLQKTEGERKQLVANIIWRVRSAVAKPLGPADGYSANKQAEMLRNNALWLSQFRDKLLTLTVVPLKRFYRVLIGFTDGTGRLPDQWWAMKMTTATESPRMAQFSSAYIRTAPTFVKNSVVVNVNWHTSMHSVL